MCVHVHACACELGVEAAGSFLSCVDGLRLLSIAASYFDLGGGCGYSVQGPSGAGGQSSSLA